MNVQLAQAMYISTEHGHNTSCWTSSVEICDATSDERLVSCMHRSSCVSTGLMQASELMRKYWPHAGIGVHAKVLASCMHRSSCVSTGLMHASELMRKYWPHACIGVHAEVLASCRHRSSCVSTGLMQASELMRKYWPHAGIGTHA